MGRRPFKELERAYGFDEVAIVPGQVKINPDLTSTKMNLGEIKGIRARSLVSCRVEDGFSVSRIRGRRVWHCLARGRCNKMVTIGDGICSCRLVKNGAY